MDQVPAWLGTWGILLTRGSAWGDWRCRRTLPRERLRGAEPVALKCRRDLGLRCLLSLDQGEMGRQVIREVARLARGLVLNPGLPFRRVLEDLPRLDQEFLFR